MSVIEDRSQGNDTNVIRGLEQTQTKPLLSAPADRSDARLRRIEERQRPAVAGAQGEG